MISCLSILDRDDTSTSLLGNKLSLSIGRLAITSLYTELTLAPKPGLVTPFDSGSHADMNAATFFRSIISLRSYFVSIATAGLHCAPFNELNKLGKIAETKMMQATNNVNTHRGAIFNLGLLSAATALVLSEDNLCPSGETICTEVARRWGHDISASPLDTDSNGQRVIQNYSVQGAREEGAAGFPILRNVALPCLRNCMKHGLSKEAALAHTLMRLISIMDDTNLLHRGGALGLQFAQEKAQDFLDSGGCYNKGWSLQLHRLSNEFVSHNLSPGGSADLLACAWFLTRLERS